MLATIANGLQMMTDLAGSRTSCREAHPAALPERPETALVRGAQQFC